MKHTIEKTMATVLPILLSSQITACKTIDYTNTIFTTCYPIYDFTKRIVKDHYEVINLVPAGSEPHDFEPTASKIGGLNESPALLTNGYGLDSWSDNLPDELKKKAYQVTDGIEIMKLNNVDDPHVWLSVKNAMKEMTNILNFMIALDPENKEDYQANYEKEIEKFTALDKEYEEVTSSLSNPYLVVSHAAFGYLCRDYHLNQIYISSLEPDSAPTAKAMEKIIETINEYHITTIFYEDLVSPDIAKAIAKETGIKTETLNPIESLTKEELVSEDYISVMKENQDKIKEACQ